jgi:hypothetical protein
VLGHVRLELTRDQDVIRFPFEEEIDRVERPGRILKGAWKRLHTLDLEPFGGNIRDLDDHAAGPIVRFNLTFRYSSTFHQIA